MPGGTALQPIAIAIVWHRDGVVLQLRDFSLDIADPGQWGFLGGHVDADEAPIAALRRELSEEVAWCPSQLGFLGTFEASEERRLMFGFEAVCHDLASLSLREGQELGVFTPLELGRGTAHSVTWDRAFPLTRITITALARWVSQPPDFS